MTFSFLFFSFAALFSTKTKKNRSIPFSWISTTDDAARSLLGMSARSACPQKSACPLLRREREREKCFFSSCRPFSLMLSSFLLLALEREKKNYYHLLFHFFVIQKRRIIIFLTSCGAARGGGRRQRGSVEGGKKKKGEKEENSFMFHFFSRCVRFAHAFSRERKLESPPFFLSLSQVCVRSPPQRPSPSFFFPVSRCRMQDGKIGR